LHDEGADLGVSGNVDEQPLLLGDISDDLECLEWVHLIHKLTSLVFLFVGGDLFVELTS
jgi:hypothetical protein